MYRLVAVCGSDETDENLSQDALETAENVGRLIAQQGWILLCGGRGGIMKAACKGAKEQRGTTVGILPGSKDEANEFVDIPIPTHIGEMRNFVLVNTADAVIALAGRWGTLNEIAIAMTRQKPLILVRGTGGCVDEIAKNRVMQHIESDYIIVDSAEEAVQKLSNLFTKE